MPNPETTDIRDRLLGEAQLLDVHTASWVVHLPPLLRDAAAEIERLRTLLAEEAKFWENHGPGADHAI